MQKTRQRVHSGPLDVNKPEPDSNCCSPTQVVPALDSGFILCPSKQPSAPPTHLGIRAFRSERRIRWETELKKVFRLSTRTAVKSSGKQDLAAMAEAQQPNGPADAGLPLNQFARCVSPMDSGIEGEPDRLHREVKQNL